MPDYPIMQRHYDEIDGFVPRFEPDKTPIRLPPSTLGLEARQIQIMNALQQEPRLISSAHGRIDELLFTIPKYAVESRSGAQSPLSEVYCDIFKKLPQELKLVIMTHESVHQKVCGWLESANRSTDVKIIYAPDEITFSAWAEDAYVVVEDRSDQRRYFLEPFEFKRSGDKLIADLISNKIRLESSQAPLYFHGGNILIGDDFIFMGADHPIKCEKAINTFELPLELKENETPNAGIRRFYKDFMDTDRKLVYIKSDIPVPALHRQVIQINQEGWIEWTYFGNNQGTVQPIFHIDMFITLAGRDDSGKYQVLVGDPGMAAKILNCEYPAHCMQDIFDDIAQGLERENFSIIRNPLPLVYMDNPNKKDRIWYFATANNALVEIDNIGGNNVWMPTYGHGNWSDLKKTDQKNEEIWEALGFKVTRLGDFHPFAERLGAVHCITKYLNRSQP